MQHSCYNPTVAGTCDVAQIIDLFATNPGYDWLADAPDEAIVEKIARRTSSVLRPGFL